MFQPCAARAMMSVPMKKLRTALDVVSTGMMPSKAMAATSGTYPQARAPNRPAGLNSSTRMKIAKMPT